MFMFGTIFQVALLLINAVAILNEDRFLARIGWVSPSRAARDTNPAFQQTYDQSAYGGQEIGIKARLIDLISAVRTLMRIPLIAINTLVILYEVVWG